MMPKKTAHMSTIHCMPWSQSRTVRVSPSEILRATNLSTSSSSTTGTENFITVTHSSSDSGVTWNTACVHNHVKEIHSMITRNQWTINCVRSVFEAKFKKQWLMCQKIRIPVLQVRRTGCYYCRNKQIGGIWPARPYRVLYQIRNLIKSILWLKTIF